MSEQDLREGTPSGLSAIFLPELRKLGDVEPLEPNELLNRVNAFLSLLTKIGIDIKGVVTVKVNMGGEPYIIEERHLLIIEK